MPTHVNDVTYKKYLKYKNKYLALNKNMIGGVLPGASAADASAASCMSIADLPNEMNFTMFKSLDLNSLMRFRLVNKKFKLLVDTYMEREYIQNKTYLNNLNDVFTLCKIPRYREAIIRADNVHMKIHELLRYAIYKFKELNSNARGPFSVVDIFDNNKPVYNIILKVHNIEVQGNYYNPIISRTHVTKISNIGGFNDRGYTAFLSTEAIMPTHTRTIENFTEPVNSDNNSIFSYLYNKTFIIGQINTLPLLLEKIDNISLEITMELASSEVNEEGMPVLASSIIEKIL
jgi:hypothetical protein